jgi:DMSO/TMAO reductase YedYZ molybdopterin-dependent catalytic subunit
MYIKSYLEANRMIGKKTIFLICIVMLAVSILTACGRMTSSPTPSAEIEATEYLGQNLTPISEQYNNAIAGLQVIDRSSYRLIVDGAVDYPLSLTYDQLLQFAQESRLTDLNCVEGWKFAAKWTGPQLNSIFAAARVKPAAVLAIFHTTDSDRGFTSLELGYIRDKNIIVALKLNDITLPADRGFPFQVVAEGKYGYKWAKWVDRIELSDSPRYWGYWEGEGYNNNADINGPRYENSP